MLSVESQTLLTELENNSQAYQPNESVAAELRNKTLLMLVGPSCIGKSTLMREVVTIDDRFAITGTFTTREPRDEENGKNYTFYSNSDTGIEQIYRMVQSGSVVQYAVHPTTKDIYGSVISDYPSDYDMLDTLSTAVESIEMLPTKRSEVYGIVAHPDNWHSWFDARFPDGHPKRESRLKEAADSIRWLLNRQNDVIWILNAPHRETVAAQEIIGSALGTYESNPTLTRIAEATLNRVEGLLS